MHARMERVEWAHELTDHWVLTCRGNLSRLRPGISQANQGCSFKASSGSIHVHLPICKQAPEPHPGYLPHPAAVCLRVDARCCLWHRLRVDLTPRKPFAQSRAWIAFPGKVSGTSSTLLKAVPCYPATVVAAGYVVRMRSVQSVNPAAKPSWDIPRILRLPYAHTLKTPEYLCSASGLENIFISPADSPKFIYMVSACG